MIDYVLIRNFLFEVWHFYTRLNCYKITKQSIYKLTIIKSQPIIRSDVVSPYLTLYQGIDAHRKMMSTRLHFNKKKCVLNSLLNLVTVWDPPIKLCTGTLHLTGISYISKRIRLIRPVPSENNCNGDLIPTQNYQLGQQKYLSVFVTHLQQPFKEKKIG